MSIPFIAVGNEELTDYVGETCECPACGEIKQVKYGTSRRLLENGKWGEPEESRLLGYVSCNNKTYVVALGGKLLTPRRTHSRS